MQALQTINVERQGQTAVITINREAKLNALNEQTMQDLAVVLDTVELDNDYRGIILTGAGQKSFVAGADIQEFVGLSEEEGRQKAEFGHKSIMDRIENFPKPVLAAVNGFALGGGLELAMSCHIRIASENAKFGQPEVSLGIIPGYGGTQRLPQLIGKGRALQMILSGEMIGVELALQWGLVNQVVPLEELISTCQILLDKIYAQSPQAVTKAIAAVNAGILDAAVGYQKEIELFGESFATEECREGVQAFLERRKPNF
ncbi:MAG TPA: enoyl-CoA hydratase-related protein [Sphingobacterium sp.]|nr:enoyl-CoA hydratase-related protein [Sphingobacterium sp.]